MIFSDRTPEDLTPNPVSRAMQGSLGDDFIDLTCSNPTKCGFSYPHGTIEKLGNPKSLTYEPDAFGDLEARRSVADYLNSRGGGVKVENILLTASTSEAYSYLFKLLGNPGDTFLVPTPGYPLLEHLLRLESLKPVPYSLKNIHSWPLDLPTLEKAVRGNTKGLVVVNPQNPTGCFLSETDENALLLLCQKQNLAYISDEVFLDFAYPGFDFIKTLSTKVLTFRLGGLSKSLGLPQLKLSWIAFSGPEPILPECRERLELIADTYLSVNTPVQTILKELLQAAPGFQKQVLNRVLSNRKLAEKELGEIKGVEVWPAQGGWYLLIEVSGRKLSDERVVIELLEKHHVLVQPGCFYDIDTGCFLVLSLLSPPGEFGSGLNRLKRYFSGI